MVTWLARYGVPLHFSIAVCLAALSGIGPAGAAVRPEPAFKHEKWSGSANFTIETGRFAGCIAAAWFRGRKMLMGISLNAKGPALQVLTEAWDAKERRFAPVTLAIGPSWRLPATAFINANGLGEQSYVEIELESLVTLQRGVRESESLRIEGLPELFRFDIEGLSGALPKLETCYAEYKDKQRHADLHGGEAARTPSPTAEVTPPPFPRTKPKPRVSRKPNPEDLGFPAKDEESALARWAGPIIGLAGKLVDVVPLLAEAEIQTADYVAGRRSREEASKAVTDRLIQSTAIVEFANQKMRAIPAPPDEGRGAGLIETVAWSVFTLAVEHYEEMRDGIVAGFSGDMTAYDAFTASAERRDLKIIEMQSGVLTMVNVVTDSTRPEFFLNAAIMTSNHLMRWFAGNREQEHDAAKIAKDSLSFTWKLKELIEEGRTALSAHLERTERARTRWPQQASTYALFLKTFEVSFAIEAAIADRFTRFFAAIGAHARGDISEVEAIDRANRLADEIDPLRARRDAIMRSRSEEALTLYSRLFE